MLLRNGSIAVLTALLTSSCAIHPLPQNVTGVDTDTIVSQIRCETRDAARKLVLKEVELLANRKNPGGPNGIRAKEISQEILRMYGDDDKADEFAQFNYSKSYAGDGLQTVRDYFEVIYTTGIAYNFVLTMDEKNNLDGGFDLAGPWAPSFAMGLSANFDRERSNKRTFTITDTLGKLMKGLSADLGGGKRYCDRKIKDKNYVYPIAGHIGVEDTIDEFLQVAVFDGLDLGTGAAGSASAWSDDLQFTTFLQAGVTPKLTFTPVGHGLQIADANISPLVSRNDVHEVTLGIALDPKVIAKINGLRGFAFAGGAAAPAPANLVTLSPTLTNGAPIVASPGSAAEAAAVQAISAAKARQITLVPGP